MAHYPIIKLPHQYMLIGSSACKFLASSDYFGENLFYIGDNKCGWNACSSNVTALISEEYASPLPIDLANCAIKNPIDLIPGDIIRLCGTSTSPSIESDTAFGAALAYINCEDVPNDEFQPIALITSTEDFTFTNGFVCWGIEYQIPTGLYLKKCEISFIVGFSANSNQGIKVTWTLNIER
jgi:hypothetical protein